MPKLVKSLDGLFLIIRGQMGITLNHRQGLVAHQVHHVIQRSRASRKAPEFHSYLLEFNDWHVSYGFSLGHENLNHGPYWEHCRLLINGKLTYPPKFSGDRLKMTLLGNRKEDAILGESNDFSFSPRAVGSLNMRGERREYLGSIPQSTLWGLLPALEAKKFRWVSLHGEPVKWGKALIRSIDFAEDYEPEDYE